MDTLEKIPEILQSTFEVWLFIKKNGGLDTEKYDNDIVKDLRIKLKLPDKGSFEWLLITHKVEIEDLIIAFFEVVQPFSKMMSDLLCMLEKAGVKKTNNNLPILFNFGKELENNLEFDIEHFKDWVEIWNRVTSKYTIGLLNSDIVWELYSIIMNASEELPYYEANKVPRHSKVREWCEEYFETRQWPDFILECPKSGIGELDDSILASWKIWKQIVRESSEYGKKRRELQNKLRDEVSPFSRNSTVHLTPKFLGSIDAESWAGEFAYIVHSVIERFAELPYNERELVAKKLNARLIEVLKKIHYAEYSGQTFVREILEFLNLPIWKKRYELYSAWVSTQILKALEGGSIRIHQIGGVLKFSFSGTHLATCDNYTPRLHIWSELRTPYANPVGKGRKKAIQPDYSLIIDPITSTEATILVVECKQYLRASVGNFSKALEDYAKGRPNAKVILVNYGKARQSILKKVHPDARGRTYIIEDMRPDSKDALNEFNKLVRETVDNYYHFF